MTPDSRISSRRSVPSRVRSPPRRRPRRLVEFGHATDHLHDEDGLTDARTTEEADLATLDVRARRSTT